VKYLKYLSLGRRFLQLAVCRVLLPLATPRAYAWADQCLADAVKRTEVVNGLLPLQISQHQRTETTGCDWTRCVLSSTKDEKPSLRRRTTVLLLQRQNRTEEECRRCISRNGSSSHHHHHRPRRACSPWRCWTDCRAYRRWQGQTAGDSPAGSQPSRHWLRWTRPTETLRTSNDFSGSHRALNCSRQRGHTEQGHLTKN
jgi:hypothetical protein